jgi:hypothetical protein
MNVRKETSRQLRNAEEAALFRRRQEKIESIRRKKISLGDYLTGSAAHLIDSFKKVTSKLPRGVEVWLLTRRNALLSLSPLLYTILSFSFWRVIFFLLWNGRLAWNTFYFLFIRFVVFSFLWAISVWFWIVLGHQLKYLRALDGKV